MSTALSHFVDGQTRQFWINAFERSHPALSGEFRPTTYHENEQIDSTLGRFRADEHAKRATAIVGIVARQLVSWDVPDATPTVDFVRRLHPRLVNRLFLIITGRDICDPPPGEAAADEVDEFTRELLASDGGENVGMVRAEDAVKN